MTTKILTGAYPGGYTLNPTYTGLVIETTATGATGSSRAAEFGHLKEPNVGRGAPSPHLQLRAISI
jgi:hypothetical protein